VALGRSVGLAWITPVYLIDLTRTTFLPSGENLNPAMSVAQSVSFEAANTAENTKVAGHTVTSPLVGTFYSAPSPDSPSFVNVGDRVKKGQVIGIIEAMKLMNELESDFDGVIKEILVKDEDVVEYGQPLFILE